MYGCVAGKERATASHRGGKTKSGGVPPVHQYKTQHGHGTIGTCSHRAGVYGTARNHREQQQNSSRVAGHRQSPWDHAAIHPIAPFSRTEIEQGEPHEIVEPWSCEFIELITPASWRYRPRTYSFPCSTAYRRFVLWRRNYAGAAPVARQW